MKKKWIVGNFINHHLSIEYCLIFVFIASWAEKFKNLKCLTNKKFHLRESCLAEAIECDKEIY